MEMVDPKELGQAIDMVVEHHKNSNLTIEGNKLILTKHATE